MTDKQKNEILCLIAAHREAAMNYGVIFDRVQRGEYVREDVLDARQKAVNDTICDILGYLESI